MHSDVHLMYKNLEQKGFQPRLRQNRIQVQLEAFPSSIKIISI